MERNQIQNHVRNLVNTRGSSQGQQMEKTINKVRAGDFMSGCIQLLALRIGHRVPVHLRNIPGIGFWPVPLMFPSILTHCLNLLQQEITSLVLERKWKKATGLTNIRKIFVQIACSQETDADGNQMSDLSGDHCAIFLRDHPQIWDLKKHEEHSLPWSSFCNDMLEFVCPFELLGALADNEEGSLSEELALAETGLIAKGKFFQLHTVAEEKHAQLAAKMEARVLADPAWKPKYLSGKAKHRILYGGHIGGI